jgi:hypothetical protein
MGTWSVDLSGWPIVVHAVEGTITDEQLDAYIAEATRVFATGKRHATILDATRIGSVSAYMRRRSIEWQRENAELLRAHCAATAYVLGSPVLRFVAMTVLLVTRPPTPLRVFSTREDAVAWAREQLASKGGDAGPGPGHDASG